MDPNATLEMIHNALVKSQDWDKAKELMQFLYEWINDKKGFEPDWYEYPIASEVYFLYSFHAKEWKYNTGE